MIYHKPANVTVRQIENRFFISSETGKAAVDQILYQIWEQADGSSTDELVAQLKTDRQPPDAIRASLACLSEAGLLIRENFFQPAQENTTPVNGPLVSVIIVGYNSREWLNDCFCSLREQNYSPLEIIYIDNGSKDGSIEWIKNHYPGIILTTPERPGSLSSAIDFGISKARGEYFLILNPDVKVESTAVARLVETAQANPHCAAVGAKLKFLWAPGFINGLGNRVESSAWGSDNAIGHLDLGQFDQWTDVPSVCFAAALISREAWNEVGPIDENFPMYYEDVEWSYRARLSGWSVKIEPQAIVYHAFSGHTPNGKVVPLSGRKLRNVVYGRLRFTFKIISSQMIRNYLRNYSWEDRVNFGKALLRLNFKNALAYIQAWLLLLTTLPELWEVRKKIQARRVISDADLFNIQQNIPDHLIWEDLPELTWDNIQCNYLPLFRTRRTKPMPEFAQTPLRKQLLIVSQDVVNPKMAGPGIRYLEMAKCLCPYLDVNLAVPADTSLVVPEINILRYVEDRPESLKLLVENSDIVLISGYMVLKFPFLASCKQRLVVDLYDPIVFENLHYFQDEPQTNQDSQNKQAVDVTNALAKIGDFFICGNERQRDLWMGVLMANGRINPRTFSQDNSLNQLLAVVGAGFPDRPPHATPFIRSKVPNLPDNFRIVLWGGGIWNWLDPITLVQAWPTVLAIHPEARLVFLGTRHPNPVVPDHEMAFKTVQLAEQLGEKDKSIIFFEWISYEEREALLCEAAVGVTLHPIHIETRYSIRTRVLDYLWAKLPVLITDGDVTSQWVNEYHIGRVVPPHDPKAVSTAMIELLDQPKSAWEPAFAPIPELMSWSHVVKPLLDYCLNGQHASDRVPGKNPIAGQPAPTQSRPVGLGEGVFRAILILRSKGPGAAVNQVIFHMKWLLARKH